MTILQIPQDIVNYATGLDISPWVIFIFINIALLVLGMFLETVSILVITLPILYPIVIALGFDPIWFAIIMVVNMELALISPPVGLNLFVLKGLDKENTISEIVKGVVPYAAIMVIFIVILSIFSEIATGLIDNVD